ncbi:putative acetyltransferase YhhY [Serratia entomophila]|nr:putative acetyltransferase YhhY [Serratia entomophila]CAI1955257.1 putative acetyltransferase YhhY [Serratia entomophila]CAI1964017.1 putative acetyltransferase YhhY [Serratia entomophila]CAI1988585.1 putative acetyltransferase YhhY [Serratia entomophila]
MSEIVVRHVETTDAQALHQLYSQPAVYRDTLQLPLPSKELWQQRIADLKPGMHNLVACLDGQLVGQLTVELNQRVRRRHVATFGIGVDSRSQGKGVGSSLMKAMIDICDNWAAIERIELTVFTDNQPWRLRFTANSASRQKAPAAATPCAMGCWSTPTTWRAFAARFNRRQRASFESVLIVSHAAIMLSFQAARFTPRRELWSHDDITAR